jgi:hypothetical protein
MKSPKMIFFFVVILTALFVFASPAYASGTDQQAICVANYGAWSGVSTESGSCTYASDNVLPYPIVVKATPT